MLEIAAGIVGVTAAATGLGWASMSPTSQLYGRTFIGTPGRGRRLVLTYDDGPNDPHTGRLLEVLARHGVHATFFMIGNYVAAHPEIARAVAAAGHEIGNHTWSHPNLVFRSSSEVDRELADTTKALTDAVGEHSRFFRPPFGGRRPASLRAVRRAGLEPIMWSVIGWDWTLQSTEAIERKVWSQVRGGDVIVLHDGSHRGFGWDRQWTVAATDRIIARAKAEGYEFCTVGEMQRLAVGG